MVVVAADAAAAAGGAEFSDEESSYEVGAGMGRMTKISTVSFFFFFLRLLDL